MNLREASSSAGDSTAADDDDATDVLRGRALSTDSHCCCRQSSLEQLWVGLSMMSQTVL